MNLSKTLNGRCVTQNGTIHHQIILTTKRTAWYSEHILMSLNFGKKACGVEWSTAEKKLLRTNEKWKDLLWLATTLQLRLSCCVYTDVCICLQWVKVHLMVLLYWSKVWTWCMFTHFQFTTFECKILNFLTASVPIPKTQWAYTISTVSKKKIDLVFSKVFLACELTNTSV